MASNRPLSDAEPSVSSFGNLLRREDIRLLTLTGPGGVGKTCLVLRVAGTEARAYGDGVRFVALAPLRNPEPVASAIASALDLPVDPKQSHDEALLCTGRGGLRR